MNLSHKCRFRQLLLEPLEDRRMLAGGDAQLELFKVSPALFVENQGQWADDSVHFVHSGDGASVAMTDTGPVFQLFRREPKLNNAPAEESGPPTRLDAVGGPEEFDTKMLEFSAEFVGADVVTPVGRDQAEATFNYFLGEQSNWRRDVPSYTTVAYEGLYDGIDLHTWGLRSHLKYEFHVAPGADYTQVAVRYQGIDGLALDDDGSLLINMGGDWGQLVDDAPYVYQVIDGQEREVAGRFELLDAYTYTFVITGEYDPSAVLVIDPNLAWSTYLGGSGQEIGRSVAVDASGNILVAGETSSSGWVSGGLDTSYNGGDYDAFVAKINISEASGDIRLLSASSQDVNAISIVYEIVGSGISQFQIGVYRSADVQFDPTQDPQVNTLQNITDTAVGSHTVSFNLTLPSAPGTPYIFVVADPLNSVGELSENNNTSWFLDPTADTDGDALLDIWEVYGIDLNDDGIVDFILPNADSMHKDLFVEVDAMAGRAPSEATLQRVVDAFAAAPNSLVDNPDGRDGVTLHILLDETDIPLVDWPLGFASEDKNINGILDADEDANASGQLDGFYDIKSRHFGTTIERTKGDPDRHLLLGAKEMVYRYCIFGNTYGRDGSSGRGEIDDFLNGGNDFFVTLGGWDMSSWMAPDWQAGTFMHELGHTLGLTHGGDQGGIGPGIYNRKPNYTSIMNYSWQIRASNNADSWFLDYSRSTLPTLDENNLDEADGIGGRIDMRVPLGSGSIVPENGPVDWSCLANWLCFSDDGDDQDGDGNAKNDRGISLDLNGIESGQLLHGFEDWSHLDFDFSDCKYYSSGVGLLDELPVEMTYEDLRELERYSYGSNQAPVANNDSDIALYEDSSTDLAVLANDLDDGAIDVLTFEVIAEPTSGTIVVNAGGTVTYSPFPNFFGADRFTYEIKDDEGVRSNEATVTIVVNPVNDPPLANGEEYAAVENQMLEATVPGVLSNDADVDGDVMQAVLVSATRYGSLQLSPDGSFSYTPNINFNREDSFTYKVSDGTETSQSATVTIVVATAYPWHNGTLSVNVNSDGYVTPLDALLVINELNKGGSRKLPTDRPRPLTSPFTDVSRDGYMTPIDALLVINYLNKRGQGEGEGGFADEKRSVTAWSMIISNPSRSTIGYDRARNKPLVKSGIALPRESAALAASLDLLYAKLENVLHLDRVATSTIRRRADTGDLDKFLEYMLGDVIDE